ncbi:MAG: type II secretion system protein [Phycisphaeraceae bacterium]|nr:MAG: type II secretion system protein [Phycisphaeraceae bacterium]
MKAQLFQNNLAPAHARSRVSAVRARGFTLVELLISLGLIAVLLSLMLPALSGSKTRALATSSLGRIREMARGVQLYADDHKEFPPTFGAPGSDERLPMRFDFGVAHADWTSHDTIYAFGVIPYLGTWRVAVPPGAPEPERFWVHGGVRVTTSDYHLTNTLYARPEMFDLDTMTGPEQFGAQRLSGVLFPSDKGLIFQNYIYHRPEFGTVLACCTVDVPTPIAFADHSASEHVMRRMPPGIFNPFMGYRAIFNIDIRTLSGTPVAQTRHGVRGRDRGPV